MEGSAALTQKWLRAWPVPATISMFAARVSGGVLTAKALPDGSIEFTVTAIDGKSVHVRSVPLITKSKLFKIAMAWKLPDDLSVYANGVHIASTKPADLPSVVELPEPRPRKSVDFSGANLAAKKRRTLEEAARMPRPGFRLRELDEERKFLRSAASQLEELVAALDKGLAYHLYGTLAVIRALIGRGGRNFQPLLQRVAGRLDKPLPLYVSIYEDDPIRTADPDDDYRFDVMPQRELGDEAEVDLDVWLNTPGILRSSGETVSQNDVIRIFADAAGSHFDPDAPPRFDELEAIQVYRGGEPASVMEAYAAQIGRCICHLSHSLLT